MSYPSALHVTEHRVRRPTTGASPGRPGWRGPGRGGCDRRLGARISGPGRQLPPGDAAAARRGGHYVRPAGVPGVSGRGRGGLGRAYRGPVGGDGGGAAGSSAGPGPGPGPVVAVGHSLGGDVVIGAALAEPSLLRRDRGVRAADAVAGVPLRDGAGAGPGLGLRRRVAAEPRQWAAVAEDPAEEAERFFFADDESVGVGTADRGRPGVRQADGPAWWRTCGACGSGRAVGRDGAGDAVGVRDRGGQQAGRTTAAPSSGWGRMFPAGSSRDRGGAARCAPVAPGPLRRDDAAGDRSGEAEVGGRRGRAAAWSACGVAGRDRTGPPDQVRGCGPAGEWWGVLEAVGRASRRIRPPSPSLLMPVISGELGQEDGAHEHHEQRKRLERARTVPPVRRLSP